MSEPALTLFVDAHYLSPYALSAFVALREKGLPFRTETVDLFASKQLEAPFRSRSLTARVPTLVHGEFSLSESSAIAEYLEEEFPPPANPPVYPQERRARARARETQAWLRSDLMALRDERPSTVVFREPIERPLSENARRDVAKLFDVAQRLLEPHGSALFGAWCIADTDLAMMLQRLVANGDPVPEPLAVYARRQWARPSVTEWLARAPRGALPAYKARD